MNKRINFISLIVTTLLINSCNLSTNGVMRVDDKLVTILSFHSQRDVTEFKSNLIDNFGEPSIEEKKGQKLTWNQTDFHEYKDIKLIVQFVHEFKIVDCEQKYLTSSVVFAMIDKNGNDLLNKETESFKKIKRYLKKDIENYK